jgi:hypothetical protein
MKYNPTEAQIVSVKKEEENGMLPVNAKSMFSLLCVYMEKLDSDEIDVSKAGAMSKLIGQANNLLNYELKRAALMTNDRFKQEHRSLELKNFDSLQS